MTRTAAPGVFALLLAGCASVPVPPEPPPAPPARGEVGAALLAPEGDTHRMALGRHQRFVYPTLEQPAALPAYPAELLPLRLPPVEVCVDVVVGTQGQVTAAAERADARCTMPGDVPDRAAFVAPTLAAVRAWTYWPAALCTAPDGFDGSDPCSAADATETPTPVRLSYAIRFRQHDGVPVVERGE
ncbi:hypothetical protein [Luteimonas sp. FCS-9]|uniref:hypothetical protein n=1 Tax=Luteimonas sp. FCS-9 TaxID=1547516 RepID=UPI00063EB489|nr:hypothetical protein [Luteimonas sp. FCS-9]KLJ01311.1 hypothetical protein WQ56_05905 [Luteimonas sp. FCS-9]